jgi:tRNA(Ile)-lysidine synthase
MVAQYERACRLLGLRFGDTPVLVACSGGPDSAAALLLARAVAPRAGLVACYVDHGLRPKLSIERDLVAVREQAKAAGATVVVRSIPRRRHPTPLSPEEGAREARYRELEAAARETGARLVITGHQRDDLAETSLLALVRGSGVDGVAAMPPKRPLSSSVTLVRPLLWAAKAQCLSYVRAQGVRFSEDETNADTRIPRNAVRSLLAQLERALPQAGRGIARSAALIADDRVLLDGLTARAFADARLPNAMDLSAAALRKLPVALLRRVIRHALRACGANLRNFSFEHCDAIARAVKRGRGGTFYAGSARVVLSSGAMVVERKSAAKESTGHTGGEPTADEPVRVDLTRLPRSYRTPLGKVTFVKRAGVRTKCKPGTTYASPNGLQHLDFASLARAGTLELRAPRMGDVCIPSGRSRPISLARFLGKAGVPVSRRSKVALLCAGGRVAAALGVRVMEPFTARPARAVLEVSFTPADI